MLVSRVADIEFHLLAIHFNVTRLVLDRLKSGRARGELFLELLLLQRKRFSFRSGFV